MDPPDPWKNGNAFDFDYEIRPHGKAMSTKSTQDPWGDPKLSEILERHMKYWKGRSFGLNQREADLARLDAQLKEFQTLPAIQAFRPTYQRNFYKVKIKSFGGGGGGGSTAAEEEEEEDPNARHMLGGGGSWCPCVMIVMKNPGRDENRSGHVLDRSGFPGEIAVAASKAIAQSGRKQDVHVAYVAPFYPNGEWKGDIPNRIADLFSFYFRLRLIIARPKVILAVGTYMAKFLIARCRVGSMKYVERPEFNYPFSIRLKTPGSRAKTHAAGFKFLIFHLVHPFLTKSGISGSTADRLKKNKAAYAAGFALLGKQLCVGKRKLNAFSVLMGTTTTSGDASNMEEEEEGESSSSTTMMGPPNFHILLRSKGRIVLAISGRPKRKEEITSLILKQGIGLVISLTLNPLPPSWTKGLGCHLMHIPIAPGGPLGLSEMLKIYRNVISGWQLRCGVLIHCKHGVDRSGMVGGVIMMQSCYSDPVAILPMIRKATKDPEFLSKPYHQEFLVKMYRHFHPTPAVADSNDKKRQRSEKKKPQLSHKKVRM